MFFKRVPTVNHSELKKEDLIIDVREAHEFRSNHIPNSKNIPMSKISTYKNDKPVHVICASGARSRRAVKVLRKNGIEAYNIRGGMLSVKR